MRDGSSAPQWFNITILPVDQAPSFRLAPSSTDNETVRVLVGSGDETPQTRAGVAADMSTGAPDGTDAAQALSFAVVLLNQTALHGGQLFRSDGFPAVNVGTGALTFAIAPGQFGAAQLRLDLTDSGNLTR